MKILVAEDNAQSLYLLEQYFTARHHEVWSAPNGRIALDLCRTRGAPDLVVSDALMPALDGFELCDAIRRDPQLAHLPFILYTATYTAEGDERFALSIGVDRFVVKPIEPDRLLEIVEEVHATVGRAAPRAPRPPEQSPEQLQEYARMVSVKLENKLAELSRTNAALQTSEAAVRQLNERLLLTVDRLEREIEQRKRTAELLHLAQEVGGIGTWECDATGAVHWSDEATQLLGIGPATPLPQILLGFDPEDRAPLKALLRGGPRFDGDEIEVRYSSATSPARHLFFRGGRPRGAAATPHRLGLLQDITARHDAEARRQSLEQQLFRSQKMEALGKLAGGIAHDFNNLLTAILGHAELLTLEPFRPAEVLPAAAVIIEASERARGIIDQILTFSRRQTVERKPVRFAGLVENALRLVRSTMAKNVQVDCRLETELFVAANENQIHQVLLNLCTNAAHAMRPRGGTITVELATCEFATDAAGRPSGLRAGRYVRLDVRDTGSGMDATVLDHLFEPFFTTKAAGEGTGLGLAVVHGIVQSHEGAITVESRIGQGTTFSLFFPVATNGEALSPTENAATPSHGRGQHILVVDDEPGVGRTCAQLLQRLGYEPVVLTDPIEARERFEKDPQGFAVVLVDFLMPQLTGPDLARALWARRPEQPVILIAGFGTQMDATQARAEGFCDFLTKPFTLAKLGEALARATRPGAVPRKTAPAS
jgi:signal transduction histidine kinase/DNA-binding response OmpR family regulator